MESSIKYSNVSHKKPCNLELLHDEDLYNIETSPLICRANQ